MISSFKSQAIAENRTQTKCDSSDALTCFISNSNPVEIKKKKCRKAKFIFDDSIYPSKTRNLSVMYIVSKIAMLNLVVVFFSTLCAYPSLYSPI